MERSTHYVSIAHLDEFQCAAIYLGEDVVQVIPWCLNASYYVDSYFAARGIKDFKVEHKEVPPEIRARVECISMKLRLYRDDRELVKTIEATCTRHEMLMSMLEYLTGEYGKTFSIVGNLTVNCDFKIGCTQYVVETNFS